MNTQSAISATNANLHFADRFGVPLPRGLREQAEQLSWERFVAGYGPVPGPVRLGQWNCLDGHRPSTRWGPQTRTYQATLAVGDRIGTSTAAATGPVAALITMLYEQGIAVEMLRFHQCDCPQQTATFIQGSDGRRATWAMGMAPDPAFSALGAVIGCANRLLTGA